MKAYENLSFDTANTIMFYLLLCMYKHNKPNLSRIT